MSADQKPSNSPSNGGLKGWLKNISREVVINYLANAVETIINWFIANWKKILIPFTVFLWGILVEFARKTYSVTGTQIIISISLVIVLLVSVFNARKIRKWVIGWRKNFFTYKDFHWKYIDTNTIIGPFCTNCGKQMLFQDDDANSEMGRTIDEMFGEEVIYKYHCGTCSNELEQDFPPDKLRKQALEYYLAQQNNL